MNKKSLKQYKSIMFILINMAFATQACKDNTVRITPPEQVTDEGFEKEIEKFGKIIRSGKINELKEEVKKGNIKLNIKNSKDFNTLHFIVHIHSYDYNLPEIFKAVKESGANIKEMINAKNHDGDTPLNLAVIKDNESIAQILLDEGADVNAKDRDGITPLYWAVMNKNEKIVQLLLDAGADVNAKDIYGQVPLHRTVSFYDEDIYADIAEALLKKRVHIEAKDNDGRTTLLLAVSRNNPILVKVLIKEKANVNTTDKHGLTPLHWAVMKENEEIVQLLIDAGANVNAKDPNGWTPLDYVKKNNNSNIEGLLIAKNRQQLT